MDNTYTETEKLLRDKMNELSENAECLDKITARVFPTIPVGAEDDEYIITDLEVVTGRSRGKGFFKWIAIAAAVVLCLVFIPKSGTVNRFFCNVGTPGEHSFRDITSAVERLTADGDYRYIDVPLSVYSTDDILVTPLFTCPFENTGTEDLNVRIYIRQCPFDEIDTAEVYAVEYAGKYTPDSIIAAAEPVYTFTDEELTAADVQLRDDEALKAAGGIGNAEGLASYSGICYVKDGDKAVLANEEVLYGSDENGSFYDISISSGDKKLELPERGEMWKRSVYSNGSSAYPKPDTSRYERRELFDGNNEVSEKYTGIYVFSNISDISGYLGKETEARYTGSSIACKVNAPADSVLARRLRMFMQPDKNANAIILSSDGKVIQRISSEQLAEFSSYKGITDREQSEIAENIRRETEKQNKESRKSG